MNSFNNWDNVQEFDLETAARFWYWITENVSFDEVIRNQYNKFYNQWYDGIKHDQVKIEDLHLDLVETKTISLTQRNLIKFFSAAFKKLSWFLGVPGLRWLCNEIKLVKQSWRDKIMNCLMEGYCNDKRGIRFWLALLINPIFFRFKLIKDLKALQNFPNLSDQSP